MESRNKHESTLIRKKFRKSVNYRCCGKPTGNMNKTRHCSMNACCTYPMVWKRYDIRVESMRMSRLDQEAGSGC